MKAETKVRQTNVYWSEAEDLKLSEGMTLFGKNWQKVAAHIGTRSAVQAAQRAAYLNKLHRANL